MHGGHGKEQITTQEITCNSTNNKHKIKMNAPLSST